MIEPDTRRELDAIKQGATYTGGTFTLNVSSTLTTVSRRGISSGSVVHYMATSSVASQSEITRIVCSKDSFLVTHSSSSTAGRVFVFDFSTPI